MENNNPVIVRKINARLKTIKKLLNKINSFAENSPEYISWMDKNIDSVESQIKRYESEIKYKICNDNRSNKIKFLTSSLK